MVSCIADTLATILRNSGYEVMVAYDAESALRRCNGTAPEVVISDVVMPGKSGIEMAIEIRQRHAECKILLSSGMTVSSAASCCP